MNFTFFIDVKQHRKGYIGSFAVTFCLVALLTATMYLYVHVSICSAVMGVH